MTTSEAVQQDEGSSVRLVEVLGTLSLAIDLNVGQSMEHALRSAILAVRLGEAVGLDEIELTDCYYLALLRHVGCTAEARTAAAVFRDEITARTWFAPVVNGQRSEMFAAILRNMGKDKQPLERARRLVGTCMGLPKLMHAVDAECEVARQLAERWGFGAEVQSALTQALERWDGQGMPHQLRGEAISRPMRVTQLALDAELFFQLGGVEAAVAMARQRAQAAPTILQLSSDSAPMRLIYLLISIDRPYGSLRSPPSQAPSHVWRRPNSTPPRGRSRISSACSPPI